MPFTPLKPVKFGPDLRKIDESKPQIPKSLLEVIIPTMPFQALLVLSQVSRSVRKLATKPNLWTSLLESIDVSSSASDTLLEDTNATNVLNRGYVNRDPYRTFLRVYRLLGPLYDDPESILDTFVSLADQARALSQVQVFASLYPVVERLPKLGLLSTLSSSLKSDALTQVESLLGSLSYAQVAPLAEALVVLGEPDAVENVYLGMHSAFGEEGHDLADPAQFFVDDGSIEGSKVFDVPTFDKFLTSLALKVNRSAKEDIPVLFPDTTIAVWRNLYTRLVHTVLSKLVSNIFAVAKLKSEQEYFRLTPVVFTSLDKFLKALQAPPYSAANALDFAKDELYSSFHHNIQTFLLQQRESLQEVLQAKVAKWNRDISASENEAETFLWSNVPKQADKTNFLSSFKRALYLAPTDADKGRASPQPNLDFDSSISSIVVSHPKPIEDDPVLSSDPPSRSVSGGPFVSTKTPTTEFEAQVAVLISKLQGIKTLFSFELTIDLITECRYAISRARMFINISGDIGRLAKKESEGMFVDLLKVLGGQHVQHGFAKALATLKMYDPKKFGRLLVEQDESLAAVEPLAIFAELINVGDLIQRTLHLFFEEELVLRGVVSRDDFAAPSVIFKRKFEQVLDDNVSEGLNTGIDVLMDQIDFVLMTEQLGSDFCPSPQTPPELGPTNAARKVVTLARSHIGLLQGAAEKSVMEVFQQEVGLRLFHSISKHIKRKQINQEGAITLISDINYYYKFILGLRQRSLYPYFEALKEVGQLFLIASSDSKQIGYAISDMARFRGVITPEELLEFIQRRTDWPIIRPKVEKVLYGFGECTVS